MISSEPCKLIGGLFGLPDPIRHDTSPTNFALLDGTKFAYFANARSAIHCLAKSLSPRKAWLPSYLCEAVCQALTSAHVDYQFYPVSSTLGISSSAWIASVQPGDLVIFIDYFGFLSDRDAIAKCKNMGAFVLEDASQALLTSSVGLGADAIVFSPRKFVGVPDGGLLYTRSEFDFSAIKPTEPPQSWWLGSYAACLSRRDFDRGHPAADWFRQSQESEAHAPCGPIAGTDFSLNLLHHCFDFEDVSERRRANFEHLLTRLRHIAVYQTLPDGVVPLGFPIHINERDSLRKALFSENIFPPVHWPIVNVVPPEYNESHNLSKHTLTLVCDQRYNIADMNRTATCVLKHLGQ